MNGIDCSSKLTNVSCETLTANGVTHAIRYLDSGWKGLTADEVKAIQDAGLNLISVYETNPTQGSYFTKAQGVFDANDSYSMAQKLGQPENTTIYFTVDFDAQTKDFVGILNYFQGIKDTLTSYKIGVYGKYQVIQLIQSKGLADYFFQTYAWSNGQHAKGLHLFQYQNDVSKYGLQVDLVNVENLACGHWMQEQTKPTFKALQVVKALVESDVRQEPSHDSEYITNVHKDQLYNVVEISGDWKRIILDDKGNTGWVDANKGENLYWVDNPALNPQTQKYTVKSGDSLTKIASIFKTSVDILLTINPSVSNPNKINVGQVLNVPK